MSSPVILIGKGKAQSRIYPILIPLFYKKINEIKLAQYESTHGLAVGFPAEACL